MSSSSGTTHAGSSNLSLDHQHLPPSEQLCYLHCTLCDTVLAVSVPSSSLFKAVTVRCGHCSSLLPLNLRAAVLLPASNHFHLGNNLTSHNPYGGAMPKPSQAPSFSLAQPSGVANYMSSTSSSRGGANELPRPPTTNRPPEKRQRVPSAYNRFIKDEIQRIKAGNPDISHREAFSAAAKNWAHFPHIHFGLMPDQTVKRTSNMRPHHPQEAGEVARMKDGFYAASANIGVSPY